MATAAPTGSGGAYMRRAQRADWETPAALFDELWAKYGPFDLDPCGQREHHYSAFRIHRAGGRFFDGSTDALDGLIQPWDCDAAYVNPPYGDELKVWVARIVGEVAAGHVRRHALALLPVRPDTKWWQQYVLRRWDVNVNADEVDSSHRLLTMCQFLDHRVKFVGAPCARCPGGRPSCATEHVGGVCAGCGCDRYVPTGAPFPSAVVVWQAAPAKAGRARP
jgi:hypothetical protein